MSERPEADAPGTIDALVWAGGEDPENTYKALAYALLMARKKGLRRLSLKLGAAAAAPWVARLKLAALRLGLTLDLDEQAGPARSNSFVYTEEAEFPAFSPADCPYRAGRAQLLAPHRAFLLCDETHVVLYRTESRDFSTAEIWGVLREKGQVYLDESRQTLHGAFASDLAATALLSGCRACPSFTGCPGLHERVAENRFLAAAVALEARIGALGGALLDVGGGDLPYIEVYREGLRSGRIRSLTCIEPQPGALMERLAAEQPERVRLIRAPLAAAPPPPNLYDAILVLRSHNHLPTPFRSYECLLSWLAPGGKLLLADNIAYGVLRRRADFQRIKEETRTCAFEHLRNDDLPQALLYFAALPVTLSESTEITPETANQWLAVLDKANEETAINA